MLELADSMDLKSIGVFSVRVQVPPSALGKMPIKLKKLFLPGLTFFSSLYVSILFSAGLIAGYLATKVFHDKLIVSGKIKSVFLPLGKWRIHLHHWIMGLLVIIILIIGGWLSVIPKFCLGMVCGLSLHDLYFDKEWYKIFLKKH